MIRQQTWQKYELSLIEVIVAVTVLAIITPVIGLSFHVGADAYRRLTGLHAAEEAGRGVLLVLKDDLLRLRPLGLAGNRFRQDELAFVCFDVDLHKPLRVRYQLRDGKLIRRRQPVEAKTRHAAENAPGGRQQTMDEVVLAFDAADVRFAFYDGSRWRDELGENELPQQVRCRLLLRKGETSRVLSTVYQVPAYELKTKKSKAP